MSTKAFILITGAPWLIHMCMNLIIMIQAISHCLTAPSHYLNQCWLLINEVLWHSSGPILQELSQSPITELSLKITYLKVHWNFSGFNKLMSIHASRLQLLHREGMFGIEEPCYYWIMDNNFYLIKRSVEQLSHVCSKEVSKKSNIKMKCDDYRWYICLISCSNIYDNILCWHGFT